MAAKHAWPLPTNKSATQIRVQFIANFSGMSGLTAPKAVVQVCSIVMQIFSLLRVMTASLAPKGNIKHAMHRYAPLIVLLVTGVRGTPAL
jgi:hypothetical protein